MHAHTELVPEFPLTLSPPTHTLAAELCKPPIPAVTERSQAPAYSHVPNKVYGFSSSSNKFVNVNIAN